MHGRLHASYLKLKEDKEWDYDFWVSFICNYMVYFECWCYEETLLLRFSLCWLELWGRSTQKITTRHFTQEGMAKLWIEPLIPLNCCLGFTEYPWEDPQSTQMNLHWWHMSPVKRLNAHIKRWQSLRHFAGNPEGFTSRLSNTEERTWTLKTSKGSRYDDFVMCHFLCKDCNQNL